MARELGREEGTFFHTSYTNTQTSYYSYEEGGVEAGFHFLVVEVRLKLQWLMCASEEEGVNKLGLLKVIFLYSNISF